MGGGGLLTPGSFDKGRKHAFSFLTIVFIGFICFPFVFQHILYRRFCMVFVRFSLGFNRLPLLDLGFRMVLDEHHTKRFSLGFNRLPLLDLGFRVVFLWFCTVFVRFSIVFYRLPLLDLRFSYGFACFS